VVFTSAGIIQALFLPTFTGRRRQKRGSVGGLAQQRGFTAYPYARLPLI